MKVQIVMPVSRPEYLHKVFTALEFLECDRENTGLLVLVDGNTRLYDETKNYVDSSKFVDKQCILRRDRTPVKSQYAREARRPRISAIHNELRNMVADCEYLFLIEDDGILPPKSLVKLINDFVRMPYAGFISGVCIGRHGIPHIGAWKVDDVYEPQEINSVNLEEGLVAVDATGLYAMLIPRELYIKHEFHQFDDILGPDFDLGLTLRRTGFTCFLDSTVRVEHLTKEGPINFINTQVVQARFRKINKSWRQEVVQPTLAT